MNKGWAGHVIERILGLPLNSAQSPNFGSWELKVIPLRDRAGTLYVKETMAITMLDPYEVTNKTFRESHLFNKLCKIVICARIFESTAETHWFFTRLMSLILKTKRSISKSKTTTTLFATL